jgi:outer membrane protein assembly factor BamB
MRLRLLSRSSALRWGLLFAIAVFFSTGIAFAENPLDLISGTRASDYSSEPIWFYEGNKTATRMEIGDLNGDDVMDVVINEYDEINYSDSSRVIALNGVNGDTLWTFWVNDGIRVMASADINLDGVIDIVIGGSLGTDLYVDGRVRAIDGTSGDELWNFFTDGAINNLAIGNYDNSGNLDVAAYSFDDYLYAINGSDGSELWHKYFPALFVNDIDAADVNGDGIDDIAYTHEYLTGFDNLMGVVDGSNGFEIWEHTRTYFGSDVLLDDIDDDGEVEAVFGMHFGDDHGEVQVYNALTGMQEWSYDIGAINHSTGEFFLRSFDIDDDKDKDLIVGNYMGPKKVLVFDGDVNTPSLVSEDLTRWVYNSTVGDVDNDGVLEIVAASFDRVQIINSITGDLEWYYAVNGRIDDVRCADFDGDGWTDISASGGAHYNVSGTNPQVTAWALKAVQTPLLWEYEFGENGNALTVVDLNQDGHDDVVTVVSGGGGATAIDGKTGVDILWNWIPTANLYSVTHGDFDDDGDQDIVTGGNDNLVTALDGYSGDVMWQFTNGTGTFARSILKVTDINGDGVDDVVAGSNDDHVYAIDGLNGTEIWNYNAGGDLEEIELAQMNGTGPLDVVCGTYVSAGGSRVLVLDGTDGSFMWDYVCPQDVEYVEVFDVNDDGTPDVAAGITINPQGVYMIDGATHDTLWTVSVRVNDTGYNLSHGDINGDGIIEVLVGGNYYANSAYVYNGLTGAELWNTYLGDEVESILGYDVNLDGNDEVIVGNDNNTIYVFDGEGNQIFSYPCADGVKHIQVGDISADGEPNIACLTFGFIGSAYAFKSLVPQPNNAPYAPSGPDPEDEAIDVDVSTLLSWTGGDPDGDAMTYDVYLGIADPPALVSDDQTAVSYTPPSDLMNGTQYFWKIIAFDEHGSSTEGPLWTFTTIPAYTCGDCNDDGNINISDAVWIINYVFIGGDAPNPLCVGDANADGGVNVSDAVHIINYVFIGGDPPDPNCCGK